MEDRKLLERYVDELLRWNKKYSLIGKSVEENIWNLHIPNSLEIIPYLSSEMVNLIVDIGSGNGLPSIPLAISLREKTFYLTEVNSKKLAFLTYVVKSLNLDNVKVIDINEGFFLAEKCLVVSRAFSDLTTIIKWSNKHLKNPLKFFIFKGKIESIKVELEHIDVKNYEIVSLKVGNLLIFER